MTSAGGVGGGRRRRRSRRRHHDILYPPFGRNHVRIALPTRHERDYDLRFDRLDCRPRWVAVSRLACVGILGVRRTLLCTGVTRL